MGKHWAIETERSEGDWAEPDDGDFVRGDREDDPQTAEEAVKYWRDHRHLYFINARARRTTDVEDVRLQLGLDEDAASAAERKAQIAEARKARELRGSPEGKIKYDQKKQSKKKK